MSKRRIAFVAAFVLTCSIAGCSSGSSSAESSSDQASAASTIAGCSSGSSSSEQVSASSTSASTSIETPASSGSPLFTELSWPADNRVVEEVPMPEFSVGIDSLNTSDNVVTATWNGAEDQEVVDYVQALQDADFTYNVSESKSSTNYSFNAYNNESIEDTTIVNLSYTAKTADRPSVLSISVSRIR